MTPRRAPWVPVLIVLVGVLGALNSFSSRIRAQAFGSSNYVVTIINTVIQCAILVVAYLYGTALGLIPRGQLTAIFRCTGCRWSELGLAKYIVVAGVADIAGTVTGFTAEPHLTTLTYSLMNQATVPFTVVFSFLLLDTRFTVFELVPVLVVMCAAVCCALLDPSATDEGHDSTWWAIFTAITTSFAALSFTLKERAFRSNISESPLSPPTYVSLDDEANGATAAGRAHEEVGSGRDMPREEELSFVTVSVVGNCISLFACVPIVLLNRQIVNASLEGDQPPFGEAVACLWTCDHAAVSFAVYASVNLLWNAALILLTSQHSALLTFLALKLQVPLVAILSFLDWPLIGPHPASQVQWATLIVMATGIAAYRWGNLSKLHSGIRRQNSGLLS